jgi:hypothetical protein
VTRSIVWTPLQSEFPPVFKSSSQDQNSPFWSSSIAIWLHRFLILSPSFPFLLLSRLISPLYFIYLLSILVEVLLRLLTQEEDLVLLYLVSGDHS